MYLYRYFLTLLYSVGTTLTRLVGWTNFELYLIEGHQRQTFKYISLKCIYFIIYSCPTHHIIYFPAAESRTHLLVNNTSTNMSIHILFFLTLKTFLLQYLQYLYYLQCIVIKNNCAAKILVQLSKLFYSASPAALVHYVYTEWGQWG